MRFFFVPDITGSQVALDEDTSKHITQVLRMKAGDELLLTDGKGTKAKAIIEDDHRKRCVVRVLEKEDEPQPQPRIAIAISLVKNAARFEWFLEKATEIGVSEIIPLICSRTEKEKFRLDRLQGIITSALLQSQQSWMPVLHEPVAFNQLVASRTDEQKFIAHCLPNEKTALASVAGGQSSIILIGPEGDFTPEEIEATLARGYQPVALGDTRLRTETAGMVAATILRIASPK
ncbi:RsmE family RNA methyltransferase [Pseudocnuella soli]|uniref:RsmE family RNA methyltransferase n=1 Tax=Pseudocnuella soli TaxID=2502779 RepID=UPI001051A2BB|nr:RsmE family RNA methyltransferase [Pseudocnuella soli]